ncbi:polysaccharide biosynthesis protein [Pseudomonas sp. TMW22090]|uniref:lipopolysaccharide biosynthesis protein n=1 Tax=Pseudomonas sp. TMW22090 TaxID=2506434 RepID=UPI001F0E63C9|nr:oligosaccharide flippase family protein [Pseudomonas sp. TMW22090]MCH4880458.1 polysaccharide biosynthesis protein [Pseudomonas sp. TMW22090]
MSLKLNILSNYTSQMYVTGLSILILPLYIKHMGAEAYGLVGFFTMLQAWFALLDLGLTPTIARETARYHGGSMSALAYSQLFRALSLIFCGIAVVGGGGLWLLSEIIATHWLNVTELPLRDVVLAVQIMAVSVALRWMGGLYRGVVTGSERLIWLSGFNALIATLRFIAVFASMNFFGFTPIVFFTHQMIVALVEIFGLFLMTRILLPASNSLEQAIGWSFQPVQPLLKFALTIAFTSSVWILATQTDKLILSGILRLAEYGYFSLAVLVASGVVVVSGPISNAIMPRMARLHAEGKHEELIMVYRKATQLVSTIGVSAAITLVSCAKPLLFAWTGDMELAVKAAPVVRLYAMGNAFLIVAAFSFYLQYAKGNLRYHLIGNAGMAIALIPTITFAAIHYGTNGAGYVWLIMNALFLLCWVAYTHHKLEPNLHLTWISDIIKIVIPAMLSCAITVCIIFEPTTRIQSIFFVAVVAISTLAGAVFFFTLGRVLIMIGFVKPKNTTNKSLNNSQHNY